MKTTLSAAPKKPKRRKIKLEYYLEMDENDFKDFGKVYIEIYEYFQRCNIKTQIIMIT